MEIQVMVFIGGRNLALSMLCNVTPPVALLLFTIQIYLYSLNGKLEQPGYDELRPRFYSYLDNLTLD